MLRQKCNKYLLLFAVQILIVLALLPGCFREEQLIFSRTSEDLSILGTYSEDRTEFRSDSMTLSPGVYQVRVWSNVTENQRMSVELCYEDGPFRAIKTNALIVFPNDEYIDCEAYVSYELSDAYLLFEFNNMDVSGVTRVDVWRTSMGNRMTLFVALLGFLALDGMLLFRKRILEGKVSKEQQIAFWVLTATVLLAYVPYMTDYYYIGADTLFHWGRVAFLKDTLAQGAHFPIRIQDTWLYDHGYIVSIFYGDLMIYIPAILMLIGFSLMTSYKIFILIMIGITAIISYACLKKCVKDVYAALFGTVIYLLAPYYIFNIYNRSALGEITAMAFLPLIFCGIYLLYTGDVQTEQYKKYKWYIVLGMSVVMQCHIISTELTIILMAVFCVCFWKKTFRKQTFMQLLEAVGLVLLLNAWFWIPLLFMMGADTFYLQNLPQDVMQERGLLFASFFQMLPNKGSAQTGMYCCEPVHVGAGALMLLVLYPIWKWVTKKKDGVVSCLAIICAVMLCISTKYFPWDAIRNIPVVGYVVSSLQFPSRWMIWATILVGVFAAFFYKRIMSEGGKLMKMALGVVALITVGTAVYHVNSIVITYGPTYLYEEENMGTHSVGNGEYVLAEAEILEIHFHDPIADEGVDWSQYEKEGTDVTIDLHNTTGEVRYIEIPLMGYKGYELEAESAGELPYITEERGNHGDLRIAVPAGYEGTVDISYKGFALFRVAEVISVISIFAVIVWSLYRKGKKLRNEQ